TNKSRALRFTFRLRPEEFSNVRSQAALKARTWMVASRQSDEAAVFEVDFSVLAGLVDSIYLEASLAQDNECVSERSTHLVLFRSRDNASFVRGYRRTRCRRFLRSLHA